MTPADLEEVQKHFTSTVAAHVWDEGFPDEDRDFDNGVQWSTKPVPYVVVDGIETVDTSKAGWKSSGGVLDKHWKMAMSECVRALKNSIAQNAKRPFTYWSPDPLRQQQEGDRTSVIVGPYHMKVWHDFRHDFEGVKDTFQIDVMFERETA